MRHDELTADVVVQMRAQGQLMVMCPECLHWSVIGPLTPGHAVELVVQHTFDCQLADVRAFQEGRLPASMRLVN